MFGERGPVRGPWGVRPEGIRGTGGGVRGEGRGARAGGGGNAGGTACWGPRRTRAARVRGAGPGGQIRAASSRVALIEGFEFGILGPRRLRDLSEPLQLFQVCADGLRRDFPA